MNWMPCRCHRFAVKRIACNAPAPVLAPRPAPRESSETQRLSAALALLSKPIVVINARHLIVTVNPAIGTLFGYGIDELKGKPVSMLIAERDRQKHDDHLRIHTRSGDAKGVAASLPDSRAAG